MLSNTILSASERHGQPGEVRQTRSWDAVSPQIASDKGGRSNITVLP